MPTAPDSPEVHLRPCATDLCFWAEVPAARVAAVQAEGRRPVLASGCGAVSTFLAEPTTVEVLPRRGDPPEPEQLVTGRIQRHGAGAAGAE